jgi:hypothetical protein
MILAIIVALGTELDVPPPPPTPAAARPAMRAISAPSELTALLEERWPLANIRRFCTPNRRHWNGWQNLVTGFHRPGCINPALWSGELYEGQSTGYAKISWYGDACDGTAETYSLGVQRGGDYWLLEIGTPASLNTPPIVAPSPDEPRFVHGRHHSNHRSPSRK